MSDTPKEREAATMGSRPIARRTADRRRHKRMSIRYVGQDGKFTDDERSVICALSPTARRLFASGERATDEDGARIKEEVDRALTVPETRADCPTQRPCNRIACRHNLWPTHKGSVSTSFVTRDIDWMTETCALDCAEKGGMTLDDVGSVLGITRERTRQIEASGLESLRPHFDDGILEPNSPPACRAPDIVEREPIALGAPGDGRDAYRIGDRRRARQLTQPELASIAGVSRHDVRHAEQSHYIDGKPYSKDGRSRPSAARLGAILAALDATPEEEPITHGDLMAAYAGTGLNYQEIADEAGLSRKAVRDTMRGITNPRHRTARAILEAIETLGGE